jgi:hypothetical protein
MGRTSKEDYARHYRDYQGKPDQIAKRSERNKARRIEAKKLNVKPTQIKGDVDHKKPIRSGGGNGSKNLRVISPHRNRGWKDGV